MEVFFPGLSPANLEFTVCAVRLLETLIPTDTDGCRERPPKPSEYL